MEILCCSTFLKRTREPFGAGKMNALKVRRKYLNQSKKHRKLGTLNFWCSKHCWIEVRTKVSRLCMTKTLARSPSV